MKIDKTLTISIIGHVLVLGWGIVSFATRPFETTPAESMPIDIISADQLSKMTAGRRDAKEVAPKPEVEKVAEKKPVEDNIGKITEKKEVVTAAAKPPEPPVEKPVEKKPDPPKPEPKPKPEEAKVEKKDNKPKPDPIAEALKKDETKHKPVKKVERKIEPPKPRPRQEPKFNADKIAALIDKRDPTRQAMTGDALNNLPSAGAKGEAAQLSQTEIDALRARLMQLWNPPVGVDHPEELLVRVVIVFKPDARVQTFRFVNNATTPTAQAAREAALRAIMQGQPYNMLSPSKYDTWKEIDFTFDPKTMFRN